VKHLTKWLLIGGLIVGAIWFFFFRSRASAAPVFSGPGNSSAGGGGGASGGGSSGGVGSAANTFLSLLGGGGSGAGVSGSLSLNPLLSALGSGLSAIGSGIASLFNGGGSSGSGVSEAQNQAMLNEAFPATVVNIPDAGQTVPALPVDQTNSTGYGGTSDGADYGGGSASTDYSGEYFAPFNWDNYSQFSDLQNTIAGEQAQVSNLEQISGEGTAYNAGLEAGILGTDEYTSGYGNITDWNAYDQGLMDAGQQLA
jgi:hypothetical protein